jgi:glycogen(starch) synthase
LIANPVRFDAPRAVPVTALRRWLFVGRLGPLKGVGQVLEAFAACHEDDPSLTLTVIGEGVLRGELTERAVDLKVADAVTFRGALPPAEAQCAMREHDLLVHASRLETFGVTVVEAVAAGMPVLVTRCGGPEETLAGIEDAAGELVEISDGPDSLIAGYRRLRDRLADGSGGLDPARARAVLAARYGYPAVAGAHHAIWFDDGGDGPGVAA